MDKIKRAIVFGGKAIVSILDTKSIAQTASDLHGFSTPVANAMARFLTMGAFISANFKSKGDRLTAIIQCSGECEKMVVCGDYGGIVKGYCSNPNALQDRPDTPVAKAVGMGYLNIIKDLGMKEPYNGLIELACGNIAGDFAYYFSVSEQINSAIALGSKFEDGKCLASGGIVIQPMPGCEEEILVILEDIVSHFTDVAGMLQEKSVDEIMEFYFGHFEIEYLDDILPKYECNCSVDKIKNMLVSLGKEQAIEIVNSQGSIQVNCEFCGKKYEFDKAQVEELFE